MFAGDFYESENASIYGTVGCVPKGSPGRCSKCDDFICSELMRLGDPFFVWIDGIVVLAKLINFFYV